MATKHQFTVGEKELPFLDRSQPVNIFYYQGFKLMSYDGLLQFPFRVVFSEQGISFLYFNPNDGRDEVLFFFSYQANDYAITLSRIFSCFVNMEDDHNAKGWLFDEKRMQRLRQKWGWKEIEDDRIWAGRVLFLNFLDTLMQEEEGAVFSHSKHFSQARNAFHSNPVIRGLHLKNQFYNAAICEQENPLLISNLDVAGENWLRFIIKPQHAAYFAKTLSRRQEGWFRNEERELKKALPEVKQYKLDRDLSDDITQFLLDRSAIFRVLIFQVQQRWLHKRLQQRVEQRWYKRLLQRCGGLGFVVTSGVFVACLYFFVAYPLMKSDKPDLLPAILLVMMGMAFSAAVAILIASVVYTLFSYNLLLPKMQLAIVTSLLGILSSVEYFKMGFDLELEGKMLYIAIVTAMVVLSYIYYITKKHTGIADKGNVPFVDFLHIAGKTACVFFLSYAFSLFVSFVGINLVAEQYITNTDFIEDNSVRKNVYELDPTKKDAGYFYQHIGAYHVKTIEKGKEQPGKKIVHLFNFLLFGRTIMFPGFLMMTGLFSLFGGILFGLLFENKRISEPI